MITARLFLGEVVFQGAGDQQGRFMCHGKTEWTLLDPVESSHPYDAGEAMAREIRERLKAALGDELWDMLETTLSGAHT